MIEEFKVKVERIKPKNHSIKSLFNKMTNNSAASGKTANISSTAQTLKEDSINKTVGDELIVEIVEHDDDSNLAFENSTLVEEFDVQFVQYDEDSWQADEDLASVDKDQAKEQEEESISALSDNISDSQTPRRPAQEKLELDLKKVNANIADLSGKEIERLKKGQASNKCDSDELLKLHIEKKALEAALKKKKDNGNRQNKFRSDKKQKETNFTSRGRPSLEKKYPDLLQAIEQNAADCVAADPKRRTEALRIFQSKSNFLFAYNNLNFKS
jgi:hypothetical protein